MDDKNFELNKVIPEINRILKKKDLFICLDSNNQNIFYRINRYLRFLLRQRTYSTLNECLMNH